jgi:uncharacterized protein DUF4166
MSYRTDPATAGLNARTSFGSQTQLILFQEVLGPDFDVLPRAVQALHTVHDRQCWAGEAKVTRGHSLLCALLCRIVGFPATSDKTPVTVTMERHGNSEIWQRNFGSKTFKSVLTRSGKPESGMICERFGPFAFDIQLELKEGTLLFPVSRGRFLGLRLPRWLLPLSNSCEQEEHGRFVFDVAIALPGLGTLVHYHGWLRPQIADT